MDNESCTPKMMPKKVLDPASERRMVRAMLLFLLPLLAIGVAAQHALGRPPAAAVVPFGNLANAQLVEIRDGRGAVVLSGEFRARVDALGTPRKTPS